MSLHTFIEKVRNYPENTKKTIVFSAVGVLGVVMLSFWFPSFLKRVDSLSRSLPEIKLPSINNQADNTSDPTSQWTVYQNKDYSFSLKHPEDVTLQETSDSGNLKLTITKDTKTLMVLAAYKDTKPDYETIIEKVTVAGKDATIVRSKNTKNLNCFKVQLENKATTYIIDDDCDRTDYQPQDQNNTLLTQIVSTLNFTN